jgi:hypothetical protein
MGFQTVLDGQNYNLSSYTIQREFKAIGSRDDRPRMIPCQTSSTIGATNHFENGFPLATDEIVAEANWIEFRNFWMFHTHSHYDFVQKLIADIKLCYPATVECVQVRSPIQATGGGGVCNLFESSDEDDNGYACGIA